MRKRGTSWSIVCLNEVVKNKEKKINKRTVDNKEKKFVTNVTIVTDIKIVAKKQHKNAIYSVMLRMQFDSL